MSKHGYGSNLDSIQSISSSCRYWKNGRIWIDDECNECNECIMDAFWMNQRHGDGSTCVVECVSSFSVVPKSEERYYENERIAE